MTWINFEICCSDGERKVRRKRGRVRCFCYLPSEERQKTTQKKEREKICVCCSVTKEVVVD